MIESWSWGGETLYMLMIIFWVPCYNLKIYYMKAFCFGSGMHKAGKYEHYEDFTEGIASFKYCFYV